MPAALTFTSSWLEDFLLSSKSRRGRLARAHAVEEPGRRGRLAVGLVYKSTSHSVDALSAT